VAWRDEFFTLYLFKMKENSKVGIKFLKAFGGALGLYPTHNKFSRGTIRWLHMS
jgi:hypothetical protein